MLVLQQSLLARSRPPRLHPMPLAGLCRLRALVQDALAKHLTDSAAFFADKLVALSGGQPADVYLLAQVAAAPPPPPPPLLSPPHKMHPPSMHRRLCTACAARSSCHEDI